MCFYWYYHRIIWCWIWVIFKTIYVYTCDTNICKRNAKVDLFSEFRYLCLHRVKACLDLHFHLELRLVFIHVLGFFLASTKGRNVFYKRTIFLQKQILTCHLLINQCSVLFWSGKVHSELMYHGCISKNLEGVILEWKHTNICNTYAFIFRSFRYYKGSKQ